LHFIEANLVLSPVEGAAAREWQQDHIGNERGLLERRDPTLGWKHRRREIRMWRRCRSVECLQMNADDTRRRRYGRQAGVDCDATGRPMRELMRSACEWKGGEIEI